jgi:hypothetical protein
MLPICPYCGIDPARIASLPLMMGPMSVVVMYCASPECRKVLAVQVVGVNEIQEPRIVVPGRAS